MSGGLHHYSLANRDKVFYLASPYSHKNSFIRQHRYEAVNYIAAVLTKQGFKLLEPIGSCHMTSLKHDMPTGYEFWKERDRDLIKISDGVILLDMPGWRESVGVTDELQYARELQLPIYVISFKEVLEKEGILHEMF